MTERESILRQALGLSPEDRAFVLLGLEQSFAEDTSLPCSDEDLALFLAELNRRSAAFRTGETQARPASDVLMELRRRHVSRQPST